MQCVHSKKKQGFFTLGEGDGGGDVAGDDVAGEDVGLGYCNCYLPLARESGVTLIFHLHLIVLLLK